MLQYNNMNSQYLFDRAWVGSRAGLDAVEVKSLLALPVIKPRFLGRPAHSPLLYRLNYPMREARVNQG
jgi:hypothetical protein